MNPFHRFVILGLALPLCLQLAGCEKSPDNHLASAKAAIQAKDAVAAVLHLKNLLAKEPNNAEARVMLGETMLNAGDPGGAVIELKRARELKADENRVVPLLAEALLGSGNMRLLLEQFGSTRLSSPEAAAELAGTLAMANILQKRPEKAREVVEAALKVAPTSRTVRLALARVFVAEAKPTEAMNTVEALLRDAPNFDEAWNLKGLLLQSTDAEKALEAYAKSIQIDPRQLEALYSTAMIQLSRGDLKAARATQDKLSKAWPRNLNSLYVEARLNHLEGNFTLARNQFAALLGFAPENVSTLVASGVNELKMGAPIQAEAQLARAVGLAPTEASARYYLAQAQLRLGKPDKASAALAPLMGGAAVSPGLLVLAAQARLQQGDVLGADALFARASKQQPKDPGVRTALAAARLSHKPDAEAALIELQQISETSDSTEADYRVISERLARNESAEALKAIAKLDQKVPKDPAAAELRGQALKRLNDLPGARKAFEEALQRDKFYAPALAQLTALDLKEGKIDLAKQRLQNVLAIDRDNSQVLVMLAALSVQTGGTSAEVLNLLERATKADPLNLNAWMMLLTRHFRAGDMQAGLLTAQSAVKFIPDNVQLMDMSGRIQLGSGNVNQANSTYADLIRVAPRSPAGYMGLAATLMVADNLEAAAKVMQPYLAIDPTSIEAQRLVAEIALRRRQYAQALAIARNLQRQYPRLATGNILEAQVESAQGRQEAAIAALRLSVDKDSPDAAPVLLHEVLLRTDQTASAKEFAAGWLKRHPKDAQFMAYLGDTELDRKNWDAAMSHYDRALGIDPLNAGALNNGALALMQRKDPKALEYAQRALAIQPNRPEMLDTLAQVHVSRKEYAPAIAALRQAIGRATDPAPLQLSLAQVYVTSGDSASAISELQLLVDRGKTHPLYPKARKLLAELRRRG